jgi:hypothetical protein
MALKKSYVKEQFDTKDVSQTVDDPSNGFYTTFLAKDGSNNHDFILRYTDSSTTYDENLATESYVTSAVSAAGGFDGAYSSLTGVPTTFSPGWNNHNLAGYLKDGSTPGSEFIITRSTSSTAIVDYATNEDLTTFSDGSELAISDKTYANLSTGGDDLFFVNPQGTSRAVISGGTEIMGIKTSEAADTAVAFRNANGTGYDMDLMIRSGKDAAIRFWNGNSNLGTYETGRIRSVDSGNRLDIQNLDHGNIRIAAADKDAAIDFFFGDGTGTTGSHTSLVANQAVRIKDNNIQVAGTNQTAPNYSFLDDNDTGMYLVSAGNIGFKSGGDKVFSIPSSAGSNGQVLTTDGAGTNSWTTVSSGSSYSAGAGLDLTGTTFSVEADLRGDVDAIGESTDNAIVFNGDDNALDFYSNGVWNARLQSNGEFHVKGDIVAFSTIFNP